MAIADYLGAKCVRVALVAHDVTLDRRLPVLCDRRHEMSDRNIPPHLGPLHLFPVEVFDLVAQKRGQQRALSGSRRTDDQEDVFVLQVHLFDHLIVPVV